MVLKLKDINFNKKIILYVVFLVTITSLSFGLDVPELKGRINDYAEVIDSKDEAELTEHLKTLEEKTGIQIAVLTVPALKGDSIEGFSIKVAEKWKLGQKGEDNGALVVLALEEHDIRIEVGYGLEDMLTDATCGLILRNVIIPEFKNGDYSEGILNGVKNMVGIVLGDEELVDKNVSEGEETSPAIGIIICVVWLLLIITIILSKGGAWRWVAASSASNHHHNHSSSYSSFSSFSSSSHSSFSGGGGSFGGGGASGHW